MDKETLSLLNSVNANTIEIRGIIDNINTKLDNMKENCKERHTLLEIHGTAAGRAGRKHIYEELKSRTHLIIIYLFSAVGLVISIFSLYKQFFKG